MTSDNKLIPDVNTLIIEKLGNYPNDVRDLALEAIRLSEAYPEAAVADQLQSVVRKLSKLQEGGSQ